jgi:hypothetical protein
MSLPSEWSPIRVSSNLARKYYTRAKRALAYNTALLIYYQLKMPPCGRNWQLIFPYGPLKNGKLH